MSIGPVTSGATFPNGPPVSPANGVGRDTRDAKQVRAKPFVRILAEGQPPPRPSTPAPNTLAATEKDTKARTKLETGAAATVSGIDLKSLATRALDAEKRVEALLASAGKGRTFSASELIALQATVFRYSQTVEVISRGTDRLVGGLKQTLGTQV